MMAGRRPTLTPVQAALLRHRYELFRANRPEVLAREFGITPDTVIRYGTNKIKNYARRQG